MRPSTTYGMRLCDLGLCWLALERRDRLAWRLTERDRVPVEVLESKRLIRGLSKTLRKGAGVLPGTAPRQDEYTIICDGSFLHNREGGMFVPECKVGDFVAKDQVMGRIVNLFGDTIEEIRSPHDNAYVAALRCNRFPTHAGEIVGESVPVQSVVSGAP